MYISLIELYQYRMEIVRIRAEFPSHRLVEYALP